MFIDTHTHFTTENYSDYHQDLDIAEKTIEELILVTTTLEEYQEAKKIDRSFVKIAYGIYPSDKQEVDTIALTQLESILQQENLLALGEIGLDYYWFKDNKETQKEMLIRQIKLADTYNKPIIIHTRDSIGDTLEVLKKHQNKRKGVIHCYTGSLEMAREFIKLGYYVSFGGVLTFKNAVHPKETLKNIDLNYVLFETDAPYLTPVPFRGKENKTYYVEHVYRYAAELLDMELSQLQAIVRRNYRRLFYEEN